MADLAPEQLTEGAAQHLSRTGRPLVTLTYAQSLDGSISLQRGKPLDLSGDESMLMTHRLRAAHAAIMVGIETVIADDPRLTARRVGGPHPQPVVVDSRLRFPLSARLLQGELRPWIITTLAASRENEQALLTAGAQVHRVPADPGGRVNLAAMLETLGSRGIQSLMIEGGARLITSVLASHLADILVITIAPVFVGGLHGVEALGITRPADLPRLQSVQCAQMGDDVVIWGWLKEPT